MTLNIKMNNSNYDCIVERGSLNKLHEYLLLNHKVIIITDSGVPSEYIDVAMSQIKDGYVYIIEQGEKSKNINNFENILAYMIEKGFTRTDIVMAIGGGVCGDLAGFVASAYMRGITFYNIPTTLLSQVDSSIGGKTAIDFHGVKNIVGAFYPPHKVIIDPNVLKTLDKRIFNEGLAEAIKMAATSSKELFAFIKKSDDIDKDIDNIIISALSIKKYVVESDPNELGLRKILNFGHTIGHAIESLAAGKLLHGECVAMGMLYMCSTSVKKELEVVLDKYELLKTTNYTKEEILDLIKHDKKMQGNNISIIYCDEIGHAEIKKIPFEQLNEYFL